MIYNQKEFKGGIDQISADTQIAEDAYLWLVNGRNRFNYIDPIKKHIKDKTAPVGKKQGVFAVNNILLLFVAGKAYYRRDDSSGWVPILPFVMDAKVDRYYIEKVPASQFHFVRKLDSGQSIHAPIRATTDFKVSGTPAAVVVQDGINQPWLIIYDPVNQLFFSRPAKTYNDWKNNSQTLDDREYVPIGLNMMYKDGILYIVAPDRKSIYRSVAYRPLDFMIAVDVNGNKLPLESEGGATALSFALDFDDITCIKPVNIPDSFAYCTSRQIRIVTADYTRTLYGEPSFRAPIPITAGVVNQESFMEILGDYAFIDFEGAKTFNAVQNFKFEGRNDIFSLGISKLLKKPGDPIQTIKQTRCACIGWDNYAMFSIDTIFGNLIAVYDNLRDKWASLDITEAIRIKQFTIVETTEDSKLYCITHFDDLFQMYADTKTSLCQLHTKSLTEEETSVEHSSSLFRPLFKGATFAGTATLIEYVDGQLGQDKRNNEGRIQLELPESISGVGPGPLAPPIIPSNKSRSDNPGFQLKDGLAGKRLAYVLQWDNDAKLYEFEVKTSPTGSATSVKQKQQTYNKTYGTGS